MIVLYFFLSSCYTERDYLVGFLKNTNLFSVRNLTFSYTLGARKIIALKGISIEIPQQQLITLSGPSGSGKSTFLHLLGLIESVQEGSIYFLGEDMAGYSYQQQNRIRKEYIGLVFQRFHLIPVLTVEENVAYFLLRMGLSRKEVKKRVEHALRLVGLYEHRHKKPFTLSGGQRQRVALARAIAKRPKVILADEPTANLDQETGKQIMQILRKMVDLEGISIVISTHDPMVMGYADHQIHVTDGRLEDGDLSPSFAKKSVSASNLQERSLNTCS
ncbi:MAG: ABC transporter ATP-binding protein [Chlamydiota bacterium]